MREYRLTPLAAWSAGAARQPDRPAGLPGPAEPARAAEGPGVPRPAGRGAGRRTRRRRPTPARCARSARSGSGRGSRPPPRPTGAVRAALLAGARAGPRLVTRAVAHVNAYSRVPQQRLARVARLHRRLRPQLPRPRRDRQVRAGRQHRAGDRVPVGRHGQPRAPPERPPPLPRSASRAGSCRRRTRSGRVTMYESDGYLHPNAARRYAIGDRTPGLRRGGDGSLTIAIQRTRPAGVGRRELAARPAGPLPHDHADLRAAPLRAQGPLAAAARGSPPRGLARLRRWLDSTLRARGTKDSREEGPRRRPVRRRLRRWDAAHGQPLHRRHRDGRERPGHAARLPRRDPRAGRHPARRVRVPDPLRLARHPHAGRPPERARGHEPGRPDHEPRQRSRRAAS